MCELYLEFSCFAIFITHNYSIVLVTLVIQTDSVATFLDTWKIGIAVECEADRERELTGRLPRHCLAEHLSTNHLATAV